MSNSDNSGVSPSPVIIESQFQLQEIEHYPISSVNYTSPRPQLQFQFLHHMPKMIRSVITLLVTFQGKDGHVVEVEDGWSGFLASIGLLIASVAELLVSGYICVILTPKLCGCLRSNPEDESEGRLKTRNMVHQWVIAQNHVVPKNHQPIYVVQPVMPVHPIIQVNAVNAVNG